jgi:2-dehydropantoate 2-reductase
VSSTAERDGIDHLLVTTKAYDVAAAVASVAHRLHPHSVVLPLANGLGFAAQVAAAHPQLSLYSGTTTEGAYRIADLHIRHAGHGLTRIGALTGAAAPPWFTQWSNSPLQCQWEPDIAAALWHKLAINCAINPLTALHRCHNGELAANAELRKAVGALCDEIAAVSRAAGHVAMAQHIHTDTAKVIAATASNRSSMLQDVLAGRRTEIDYITGHLTTVAGQLDIAIPNNSALLQKINELAYRHN